MKKYTLIPIGLILFAPLAFAQSHASDDFESGTLNGGSGAWTTDWVHSGTSGGSFVNTNSEIAGSNAGALFTDGGGVQTLTRNFTTLDQSGSSVSVSWSMKGLASTEEIGVNVLGLKSDNSTTVLTAKFPGTGTDFTLNDGGSDFSPGSTSFSFQDAVVYDVTLNMEIGSADYTWEVSEAGVATENNIGSPFQYSGGGTTLTEVNGLSFFWDAPGGDGNDGLIDSVSVVPEPSAYALIVGALGLSLVSLRRRRG